MAIWDDIRRGAQTVVDESQKLAKAARLKGQVRQLEATLGDRIYDLGTRALELHRRNELHHCELDTVFAEIQALQRELREVESGLDQLTGQAGAAARRSGERPTCPDCGARLTEADRFCRHCGAKLAGASR